MPWRQWMRMAFGALNWPPEVFWGSTLTEFIDAIEGRNEANGGTKPVEPPSEADLDELVRKYG
ncbi:phage tail assembly chaperone [Pelagibacterium sp. H642]|uniref:phage tail assembly chaperone n=1 Tax=Pelagibacterium sp. H642 TaxID=1881069 RepID=UPI002814EFBD|nr:phage tail assembly chaperone [Pelagibacterium sp. H642]WMT90983.1 phage tail assembly chaperone [Pelagibacterium sp. H642]